MALRIQYNKTAIQQFQRQLSIREKALPTLKSKETALRVEVKKAGYELERLKKSLDEQYQSMEEMMRFWTEFPDILSIKEAKVRIKNIAGVRIPILDDVEFESTEILWPNQPAWIPRGKEKLKELLRLKMNIRVVQKQFDVLNYARKKTTQKVNLYEKVQIPQYKDAIRKIKRFLEDKENLSKAAQKIVKERNQSREEEPA